MSSKKLPANYSGTQKKLVPPKPTGKRYPDGLYRPLIARIKPQSISLDQIRANSSRLPVKGSKAEAMEKLIAGNKAPASDNDMDWKPTISYYNSEPSVLPAIAPASTTTSMGQTKVAPMNENKPPKPAVTAKTPAAGPIFAGYGQADIILSAVMSDVSLASANANVGGSAATSSAAASEQPGSPAHPHNPVGVQEALELNRAGRPVCWLWSEERPRVREVSQDEMEGVARSSVPDGLVFCQGRARALRQSFVEGSSVSPARNVGLNGSRHNF